MKRLAAVILTIMMVLQTGLWCVCFCPGDSGRGSFSDGTGGGRAENQAPSDLMKLPQER
ncbi:MAG: hypothetical protein ACLS70_09980 [[Clostridium] symbiosum]